MDMNLTTKVLRARSGSHLFGLNTEFSDEDFLEVWLGSPRLYLGFVSSDVAEQTIDGNQDTRVFEFRRWLKLLLTGNPNVLPTLWASDEMFLYKTQVFDGLLALRDAFLGRHLYLPFSGLAASNLKRLKEAKPSEIHLLTDCEERLEQALGKVDAFTQEERDKYSDDIDTVEWLRKKYFSGKMGQKRKDAVRTFGYDPKNAYATILTLVLAKRIAEDGVVGLPDGEYGEKVRKTLLSVKNGEWDLRSVIEFATLSDHVVKELFSRSSLPAAPDRKKVEQFCMDVLRKHCLS